MLLVALLLALPGCDSAPNVTPTAQATDARSADAVLARAFAGHVSDLQVAGCGEVVRLLPDDTQGSAHQRFILRLGSGQTLLVSHNIDLAPRIESLQVGDEVMFFGEYEWNAKGGVIHWTHHDPSGLHPAGWLQHEGKVYQ